jgi:hypothetical protein
MWNPLLKLLGAFVMLLPGALVFGQGPCADSDLRGAAVRLVTSEVGGMPQEATPLLNLTHDVIDLKSEWRHRDSLAMGFEVPVVCFFRVQLARHSLKGNKVEGEAVELDGDSYWIVAFYGERNFLISFNDSTGQLGQFNELARALKFQISEPEEALDIFYFLLEVAGGGQRDPGLVPNEMLLESRALEDFGSRFPAAKRRKAFDRWWRSVSPDVKRKITQPQAVAEGDHFRVHYFIYGRGTIWSSNLLVSKDGTVKAEKAELIGPTQGRN